MSPLPLTSLTLLILTALSPSESANIVFIHHMASFSHIVASRPLAEALVLKGHQVTYIAAAHALTQYPNITHIVPEALRKYMETMLDEEFDLQTRLEGRMPNLLTIADQMNVEGCDALLGSAEFQIWMNSTPKVDLVFIDNFPECGMGVAHKLQSKLAVFLPIAMNPKYFDALGLPTESSSIPTWTWYFKTPLSFLDRVKNTLSPLGWRINQMRYWASMEAVLKNNLYIQNLPSVDQLYKNIGIVLMNGHFLDEYRRSLPPLFVNIPGLHVRESHKELPTDLEEFVSREDEDGNGSEGFVYVSFGTVVKAPKLPQNIRQVFFKSMKAFPNIRFLWRWDGEFPRDVPKNLYLSKWFNQQDLLGHPKIRGFVTQTGRPSSQEAIFNSVPMITFPVLGDQDYNSEMLEDLGVAIRLEISDVTEKELTHAFSTILHDNNMKKRVEEVSKLYKDLPMKPIDTAVWWTEYVLRHKDSSHLLPMAIDQTWYQRRLLDVWAFLAGFIFLLALVAFYVAKIAFRYFVGKVFVTNKIKSSKKSQ